jgi:hypothetical protein
MSEILHTYTILVGKPPRKGLSGEHSSDGRIKMDSKGTGCEDVKLVHLAADRFQWRSPVKLVHLAADRTNGDLLQSQSTSCSIRMVKNSLRT